MSTLSTGLRRISLLPWYMPWRTTPRAARDHQNNEISSTPRLNDAMTLEDALGEARAADVRGELCY
jgi:hypothetical protein